MNFTPGFTGSTIDRGDNLRLDPGRVARLAADPRALVLKLDILEPELDGDGRLGWAQLDDLPAGQELIFLGLEGGAPLFAPLSRIEQAGQRAWAVFALLDLMSAADASLWATARSLILWHNRHRFCANCGAASAVFRAGWGRTCGGCAAEHYPRVDPVVIMLAEHRGRLLVGRQPQYPPGRYSALAGFVEPGESLEEAVARELREEAGIEVRNVRYVASQPWPFPSQLMIACIAEATGDELVIDRTELEDAKWVDRNGVEAAMRGDAGAPFLAPPHFAIAHTLFGRWLEGL